MKKDLLLSLIRTEDKNAVLVLGGQDKELSYFNDSRADCLSAENHPVQFNWISHLLVLSATLYRLWRWVFTTSCGLLVRDIDTDRQWQVRIKDKDKRMKKFSFSCPVRASVLLFENFPRHQAGGILSRACVLANQMVVMHIEGSRRWSLPGLT